MHSCIHSSLSPESVWGSWLRTMPLVFLHWQVMQMPRRQPKAAKRPAKKAGKKVAVKRAKAAKKK